MVTPKKILSSLFSCAILLLAISSALAISGSVTVRPTIDFLKVVRVNSSGVQAVLPRSLTTLHNSSD